MLLTPELLMVPLYAVAYIPAVTMFMILLAILLLVSSLLLLE
jgi:hypothetical protein